MKKRLIARRTFWQAKDYFFPSVPTQAYAVKSVYLDGPLSGQGLDALLRAVERWPGSGNPGDSQQTIGANVDWLDGLADSLRPHVARSAYQNFIDRSQPDWQTAYYGDHFKRLTEIKRRYVPDELFKFEQGIPAA